MCGRRFRGKDKFPLFLLFTHALESDYRFFYLVKRIRKRPPCRVQNLNNLSLSCARRSDWERKAHMSSQNACEYIQRNKTDSKIAYPLKGVRGKYILGFLDKTVCYTPKIVPTSFRHEPKINFQLFYNTYCCIWKFKLQSKDKRSFKALKNSPSFFPFDSGEKLADLYIKCSTQSWESETKTTMTSFSAQGIYFQINWIPRIWC